MKILITGAQGQLGKALNRFAPENINNKKITVIAIGRKDLDLSDTEACYSEVLSNKPDWVINAGAYTAVDLAEKERELAYAINAEAPRAISKALLKTGGQMLQISTDFVFDGVQGSPYKTHQSRNPINFYGKSKADGEINVEKLLKESSQGTVIRTSWLFGPIGNNFILKILEMLKKKKEIKIVSDQIGGPTSTFSLAHACWKTIELKTKKSQEIPHLMHWSDAGAASWYDLAMAVEEIAQKLGILSNPSIINPICTGEYTTLAKRPSYSILDCFSTRSLLDIKPLHWKLSLDKIIREISTDMT